MQVVAAAER